MRFKEIVYIIVIIFQSSGCKHNKVHSEIIIPKIAEIIDFGEKENIEEPPIIVGNYVSENDPGNDKSCAKITVQVSKIGDEKLQLKIRPRKGKESGTFIFEAVANKNNDSLFTTMMNGKRILLRITNKILSIRHEKPEDIEMLTSCSSWGKSLAGNYEKIESSSGSR